MHEPILLKKSDGKILIVDDKNNLEILELINDGRKGGQGLVAFAVNHGMGDRLETIKFYGVTIDEETDGYLSLKKKVPYNGYWERVLERGEKVLTRVGSNEFPKFPFPIGRGEYSGILYSRMSCGVDSGTDSKGLSLNEYKSGRLLTLDQIVNRKAYGDDVQKSAQMKYINAVRNLDFKDHVRYAIEILRNANILYNNYGRIHGDYKPSQIIFIFPKVFSSDILPIIQIIDVDSSVDLNDKEDIQYSYNVTTPMYNSNNQLRAYKEKKVENASLYLRDIWSLGIIGQELILDAHPYKLDAELLINKRLNEIFSGKDLIPRTMPYDDFILETIVSSILDAQNIYFENRKKNSYTNNHLINNVPRNLERILHRMLSDTYSSIDEVIEELLPYSSDPGPKITRRRAIIKIGSVGMAIAAVGIPGFNIIKNYYSFKYSYNSFFEKYNSTGKIDKDILKESLPRLVDERVIPMIKRASDNPNKVPESVSSGEYQFFDDKVVVTGGHFLRTILLSFLISKDYSLKKKYVESIEKIVPKIDDAYRVFRFIDPLREFVKVAPSIGLDSSLISEKRDLLKGLYENILELRLVKDSGFSYLRANINKRPEEGYSDAVRIADYYLIKGMEDYFPESYKKIVQTLVNFLVFERNGESMVYDIMNFNRLYVNKYGMNKMKEMLPGIDYKITGTYDESFIKSGGTIYGSSISQMLMLDLLCDYCSKFNDPKMDSIKLSLAKTYVDSMSKKTLFDTPARDFMFSPITEVNNFPFAIFAHRTISENILGMRDKTLISLLKKIDMTTAEGILPESRIESYVSPNFNIMSDYFTLSAINEYINL